MKKKNTILADRLRQALTEKGLTQAELSRMTGISDSKINCYLSGRYNPRTETCLKLANALGVTVSWLTGLPEQETASIIAENIRSGKYADRPISYNDIPADSPDVKDRKSDRIGDLPPDLQDIVAIYLSLEQNNKRRELARLYAFACELADKEQL